MITNYIIEKMDYSITVTLPAAADGTQPQTPAGEVHSWSRCAMTKNTHYTDEFVEPQQKYQYRVIAQNLQGRSVPCEPTSVITTLETKNKLRRWTEDETGKRKRGKDGFAPSDYDRCCIIYTINNFYFGIKRVFVLSRSRHME